MIYIEVFVISLVALYISLITKNRLLHYIFLIISIALPCVLAGLRDFKVGGDVNLYVYPLFIKASKTSFLNFIFNNTYMNDYLYLLLTYICSTRFNSMFVLLFTIELLIILPIYKSLKINFKNKKQIVFGMFLVYAVIYNTSFNMVRQSIGLSFSILAISYLLNNNSKRFFIYSLIAFLFHWSAFILIIIYFIYKILSTKILHGSQKTVILVSLVIFMFSLIFLLPQLSNILQQIGINNRLTVFLNNFISDSYLSNNTADTLFFSVLLFMIYFYRKYFKEKDEDYSFYLYLLILGIITMQFGSFIEFGFRLSFYFLYPVTFILLPKLISLPGKIKAYDIIMYSMFAFYWYFWVFIANYHGTYPYIFNF